MPAEQIDSVFDVGAARFDSLVVAGDDVRYTPGELVAVVEGLREHDLVVPTSVDQSRGWQHRPIQRRACCVGRWAVLIRSRTLRVGT